MTTALFKKSDAVHVWLSDFCAMGKYTMNDDVFFLIVDAEKEIVHEGILFY